MLVGLANHAGPDGTGAFPSVATLVRYTGLSERTVRNPPARTFSIGAGGHPDQTDGAGWAQFLPTRVIGPIPAIWM